MSVDCKLCHKHFATQSTANRHIRKVHNMKTEAVYDKGIWSYQCLEYDCESSFQQAKYLISHLEDHHGMTFETVVMTVESMEEFFRWKAAVELNSNCRYIFRTRYKTSTGESIYYNCNRSKTSYIPKSDDQRKRSQKSQGSCKLGHSCTSQIKVIKEDDIILIQWQKIHYGHHFELQHIRLPNHVRRKIYSKLSKGDTPKMILQTTREKIREEKLKRIDLLTAKDIRNIKNSYRIKSIDDHTYANEELSDSESITEVYLDVEVQEEAQIIEYHDIEVEEENSFPNKEMNSLEFPNKEIQGNGNYISDRIQEENQMNTKNTRNEEVNDAFSESENTESQANASESECMEGDPPDDYGVVAKSENLNDDDNGVPEEEIFIHIIQENMKRESDAPFFDDYVESDLEDPVKRHRYWIDSQDALEKYRRENEDLMNANNQMLSTINRLHDLVTELKYEIKTKPEEENKSKRKKTSPRRSRFK